MENLIDWKAFHRTDSQGPNGPALSTSIIDFCLLPEDLIYNLFILGGNKFQETFDKIGNIMTDDLFQK
jgi:hypothetical protein